MEFSTRRAMAWITTLTFINAWVLVSESDSFTSFNQMLWEVNITLAFQFASLGCYFLFIKMFWKEYHGLSSLSRRTPILCPADTGDSLNRADTRRLSYDILSRRRKAR